MEKRIKWGIAGLGRIAYKFASDLNRVAQAELLAVASSNGDRAMAFQKEFEAQKAYDNYEDLYQDPHIEIIYIASLNQNHFPMCLAALKAGKGVLCEKPLGLNPSEVKMMINTAKKLNVFLMEGLWSRFNPAIQKAKQWVDEGRIGSIKFLYAEFSFFRLNIDASHRLMDPGKGGGVLYDIGIYTLFLAYFILGKPTSITAKSLFAATGVDVQTSMILEYENAQAVLYCGIANESDNRAKIGGTEGEIILHGWWHNAQKVEWVKAGEATEVDLPTEGNGFVPQIEEVNKCMAHGKIESELWRHQDTLALSQLIEEVFQKIKN